MQIVLYAAVSLEGFMATKNGNSDWVLDDELFEKTVKNYGCVALGRTTFEQYEGDIYPIKGVQHIVLGNKPVKSKAENVHMASSVEQAIDRAKELGYKKLLVIGGAKTNESFAQAGVLTGLMVDIHLIKLKTGKKLLGNFTKQLPIKFISTTTYAEGFTHMEYKVSPMKSK